MQFFFILFSVFTASVTFASTESCQKWHSPQQVGSLPTEYLAEASGLVVSKKNPSILFHMNDSGDGPYLYATKTNGEFLKKIEILNFTPKDVEDLSRGPCGHNEDCLFVGDIGDNKKKRDSVSFVILKEKELVKLTRQEDQISTISPYNQITVTYPDHPHNAEAFFITPSGDILLFTKEYSEATKEAYPSQIFRLKSSILQNSKSDDILEFESLGELNIPSMTENYDFKGQIVTSADISPDGSTWIFLTYQNAIVMPQWQLKNYQVIDLKGLLPQEEAIAFTSNDSFIFTTEIESKNQRSKPSSSAIFEVSCLHEF